MSSHADSPLRQPLMVFLSAVAIVVLLWVLVVFKSIVLAAAVGVMLGVLPVPLIRFLKERWHMPHALSTLVIVVLLLLGVAVLSYGVYSTLAPEVRRLVEQGPRILERLNEQVQLLATRFEGTGANLQQLDLGAIVENAAQMLVRGIRVGIEGLVAIVLMIMIAIFTAANFDSYAQGASTLFPPSRRARIAELGRGSVRALRRWFVGQIVVVTISGSLTAVVLLVIGIDYWLLIAALTVILNFVPFIGAIITGAVAAVLTLGTEPDKIWWVLLAYIAIQQIESDVVLPIVMKGTVRLPEAHLLVFVLIMGTAFGLLGIFVAPLLFAVVHHLYLHAYIPWIERDARSTHDPG